MDFLVSLEESGISTWLRTSNSLFGYPFILFLHTVGLGLAFGFSAAMNFRILGFVPRMPLAPMEKFFPIIWIGFWINAASGVGLIVAEPTTKVVNPMLWIKLILIAMALVALRLVRNRVFHDPLVDKMPVAMNGRLLAFVSLLLWMGAITAGRMMAYVSGRGF